VKNKTTAAILALFLGGFGVHRFYLGEGGKGVLYIFLSFVFFLGGILGLIDAIIFFTMSEDNFNLKYNRSFMMMNQQPSVVVNTVQNVGQPTEKNYSDKASGSQSDLSFSDKKDPFETAGDEKYQDYDFDGAIKDYLKSLNVRSKNPEVHFKLGCLYSLLEKTDDSLFHLAQAVEKGFYDFEKIKTHDHLAYLRSQPSYTGFVENGYKLVKAIEPDQGLGLSDAIITQIERLAKMKDQGIISDEEFQTQKTKLLNH
jgi:TM2 domain-containing membrane protein YozV